jgi:predicted Fe-Mo cluster-binding NifX family protein
MKIAIAAVGKNLDAPFALHFGQAENFVIIDTKTKEQVVHLNPAVGSADNKGILTAQFIVDQGVNVVISGYFGPHATKVLAGAKIQMLLAPTTIRELLACYEAGQLRQLAYEPNIKPDQERVVPQNNTGASANSA